MFVISTILLGIILIVIAVDHIVLLFKFEELEKDRNRAIARIARLKNLLKEEKPHAKFGDRA